MSTGMTEEARPFNWRRDDHPTRIEWSREDVGLVQAARVASEGHKVSVLKQLERIEGHIHYEFRGELASGKADCLSTDLTARMRNAVLQSRPFSILRELVTNVSRAVPSMVDQEQGEGVGGQSGTFTIPLADKYTLPDWQEMMIEAARNGANGVEIRGSIMRARSETSPLELILSYSKECPTDARPLNGADSSFKWDVELKQCCHRLDGACLSAGSHVDGDESASIENRWSTLSKQGKELGRTVGILGMSSVLLYAIGH